MSQRQDRYLRLIQLRNRMITAADTSRRTPGLGNVRISGQTDRRRLPESELRARRPVVGYILNQCHMTARPAWARAYRRWGLQTRQHILFSDVSRFSLRLCDGRYRVYRRRGERLTDQCVYEFDRFGGGSDGHIKFKIVQGTLNAVKYRDGILDHIVLPLLQQRNFDNVFQRDNSRCHVARVCRDFLNQNYISVLFWLALLPDLSPIEHLWDELVIRFRHRQNPPEALHE